MRSSDVAERKRLGDPATAALPNRFGWPVWLLLSLLFVATYGFMWCVVHVHVDMRPCQLRLDDPLFALIPHNHAWAYLSHDVYEVVTVACVAALAFQAAKGDHRPLLRFGAALSVQAVLRSITMTLLPLCRANVPAGTIVLTEVPYLDLGIVRIPWRVWASNDLVFSGHVGEFLLIFWATRSWPAWARTGLVVFQFAQAYALLATRGHYTIDLVLAVPCAFFADATAVRLLSALSRVRALQGRTQSAVSEVAQPAHLT